MDLNAVMDELGARVDTIDDLNVYDFPADRIEPDAAILAYPDDLTFDQTYGRGSDRMTIPLLILTGKVSDRESRDRLAAYCAGSGTSSIKAVVESGTYTAFHSVHVMAVTFDVARVAGTEYAGALFDLDIFGKGSS